MKLHSPFMACLRIGIAGVASWGLAAAHADCYTVYKGSARIYHAQIAPVDTSLPYSETVPARFGEGAMMVVSPATSDCPGDNQLRDAGVPASPQRAREADESARMRALNNLAERHTGSQDNSYMLHSAATDPFLPGITVKGPIVTGPRGGQYYVNSAGGKTYVSGSGGRRR